MSVGEFLSDRLVRLVLNMAAAAAAAVFLRATGSSAGVLTILGIAWLVIFAAVQTFDYLRCRARLAELQAVMDGLDRKYLFAECVSPSQSAYERRLFDFLRQSGRWMIQAVSDAQATQAEYRAYIESWVHEIKTPITAARLMCRGSDERMRKISRELAQIDNHVERALFYARAESPEKDFIIRQSSLSDIVSQAIERHRALLIQSGMAIETEGLDKLVYTDGKWVVFMLGQLLQNAVRYRSQSPKLCLSARELGRQVQLCVEDNGIGIPTHELSRVFDRGFTGSNGRVRGGSTGMGLYLCKRLAGFLEIDLRIRSEQGKGTCVILSFPARENLSKL